LSEIGKDEARLRFREGSSRYRLMVVEPYEEGNVARGVLDKFFQIKENFMAARKALFGAEARAWHTKSDWMRALARPPALRNLLT
jgi:hypothetical protein